MGSSMKEKAELASAKRIAVWVGLILPLTLTAVGTFLTTMWVPRMPDPMALHWGADFRPDGYGPPWSNVVISLGSGLALTAMYFLQRLQRGRPGAELWGPMHRFLPAMILGIVAFLQIIAVGTAWVQLDASDARDTPHTGWVLLIGFLVWIVVSVTAYFVQPKLTLASSESAAVKPMSLTPNDETIWSGEVRPAKSFLWVLLATIGPLIILTLTLFIIGSDPVAAWIMFGSTVLLIALFVTNIWFRVRIDSSGIVARSLLGWPAYSVPAEDVKAVKVKQINPFAEYGGWGVRLSPTGFGIVLRTGEGIVIDRHSRSRSFAITIDDAESAATLLATISDEARSQQQKHS